MEMIPMLMKELEMEAQTTRKMLSIVPNDKYDWKPHEKSMTIRSLATHIAELPTWVHITFTTSELDFAKNAYDPKVINNTNDLLAYFETNLEEAKASFKKANEKMLEDSWTMRNGDQIYFTNSKAEVLRMTYCQIVHHRAQLGVFLRLLNIPIPGSYGPSADEGSM
ncbi:MAG: DinB family protein [Bacteroidetes bacterium]|nr:DinB family protein [Bacteroidota bacterium]